MGRSSKDFSSTDFDSYRNTFVGFVFQEYNILNEFSVEDNIAIASELQGKKRDRAEIADILKKFELEGLERRKPNTCKENCPLDAGSNFLNKLRLSKKNIYRLARGSSPRAFLAA